VDPLDILDIQEQLGVEDFKELHMELLEQHFIVLQVVSPLPLAVGLEIVKLVQELMHMELHG